MPLSDIRFHSLLLGDPLLCNPFEHVSGIHDTALLRKREAATGSAILTAGALALQSFGLRIGYGILQACDWLWNPYGRRMDLESDDEDRVSVPFSSGP